MRGTRKHGWEHLPSGLRAGIVSRMGSELVAASTVQGGFSPGVAARLRFADGTHGFVKAVDATTNVDSAAMHRREARNIAAIDADPAVPSLVALLEDGDWVALLYEHVDGEHPRLPWQPAQLQAVGAALQELHERLTPSPTAAPDLLEAFHDDLDPWQRFASVPDRAIRHGLTRDEISWLAEQEAGLAGVGHGDTLLHRDLRADQILLAPRGVVFLDWPHAAVGPAWADAVMMVPSIVAAGGDLDVDEVVELLPELRQAPEAGVLALLAAWVGYLLWQSDEPDPPGLPTVRAYQAEQALAVLPWLQRATGR